MPLINRVLHLAAGGGKLPIYTGEYVIYGDEKQGWIEMLTSGVLTLPRILCWRGTDMYLLGSGFAGTYGGYDYDTRSLLNGGNGGKGGKYYEQYGLDLRGQHTVTIGESSYSKENQPTTLGSYSSESGTSVSTGGIGAQCKDLYEATRQATEGSDGRIPFTGHNPMSEGFAAKKLGAAGGGAGVVFQYADPTSTIGYATSEIAQGAYGGTYGGGNGSYHDLSGNRYNGRDNTGGGGAGSTALYITDSSHWPGVPTQGEGGSGIAIVRWGY